MKSDFYVYAHRHPETREPFYIGKGQGKRAWSERDRSKRWKGAVASLGAYTVTIEAQGLTEQAARDAEADLIAQYGDTLVNVMPREKGPLSLGLSHFLQLKMSAEMQQAIEQWRAGRLKAEGKIPSFSEAVRRLIEIGLADDSEPPQ